MLVVGGGKVGWNLTRELIDKGHEVTLIESDRERYLTVEQELEHRVLYGDASELWVLERAGIARASMVIAVTGDDEDNLLICQVAKDKYAVDRVIARVNNPRNRQHFELLGVKPYVSATDLILRLIEREVPRYGLVHLLDLADAKIEIIDLLIGENAQVVGKRVGDLDMPAGSLLISVMRDGTGWVPTVDTVLEAGDEVLAVLDPQVEEELTVYLGLEKRAPSTGRPTDHPMADRQVDHLLIGAGIASAYCASELRKRDAEGSILIAGREPEPPYDRPPLSKEYLRGKASREDAIVNPREWYADNDIELLTSTSVVSLDAEARTASSGRGGGRLRQGTDRNRSDGQPPARRRSSARGGTDYLRAFGNSDSIRDDVTEAERVVCVGGSYIGAEVASSLTEMGKRVTIVEIEPLILSRVFGPEAGAWFQGLLESKGIEIAAGETVAAFEGDERVSTVLTESGHAIDCDAVVIGAGVRPDTMLAQRAGLQVDDGIVCDWGLETSVAGIFAAGDCCSYPSEIHGGSRVRFEHWDVALQQGRHAAHSMLGDKQPYEIVPYFFSDLADWASLEYVGGASEWDEVLWRGDREVAEFSLWYLAADRLVAALSVGRSEDVAVARRLIESRTEIGEHRDAIGDPDTDLDAIAP